MGAHDCVAHGFGRTLPVALRSTKPSWLRAPLTQQAHHPPLGHDSMHELLGKGPPPILRCQYFANLGLVCRRVYPTIP